MHKMDKIGLIRCAIAVSGRSGEERRPDGGKATKRGKSSYGYGIVSEGGLVPIIHPTYTIPFILCINANCSSSAMWVRVSARHCCRALGGHL